MRLATVLGFVCYLYLLGLYRGVWAGRSSGGRQNLKTQCTSVDCQPLYRLLPDHLILLKPEPIGRGGSASVYKVKDSRTGEELALKVTSRNTEESVQEAQREGDFLARFLCGGARGTVELRDRFRLSKNQYALLFELMSCDAYDLMARRGWQQPKNRIARIRQICNDILPALIDLKAIGKVHGDIKIENIFYDERFNRFKLGDFGMVKPEGVAAAASGTAQYLAPEIFAFRQFTSASDMWAFGCTLLNIFRVDISFDVEPHEVPLLPKLWFQMLGDRGMPRAIKDALIKKKYRFPHSSHPDNVKPAILNIFDDSDDEVALFDLILKMLDYDPSARISPENAYTHRFLMNPDI